MGVIMSEFKFDPELGQVVELKSVPVADDQEVVFQAEADRLQNELNTANEVIPQKQNEYNEAVKLVEQASLELEEARKTVADVEQEQSFLGARRASYAEAVKMGQEVAEQAPAGEDAGDDEETMEVDESDGVEIPVKVAEEAAV